MEEIKIIIIIIIMIFSCQLIINGIKYLLFILMAIKFYNHGH